ncbi:LrgB family protein [Sinorhizobium meliloti]|nr:LrgB family protein [Sinorhizobium meliloti]
MSIRAGCHPLCNPVLLTVIVVALILVSSGTPYSAYFEGSKFIHFLLGPATVALGHPLYKNRCVVIEAAIPIVVALIVGSFTATISVVLVGLAFGLPDEILISIAPKSATAGISMGVSHSLGGDVSLTAATTILTGIIGAIAVTPLMNVLGIKDWRARGFAAGLSAHGIGTARALQINPIAGTFSGVAMGLNALGTAIVVPTILLLIHFR